MNELNIDLLSISKGTVTAPAGCGKTHLIAEALRRHDGLRPILVLTHTNAGVAALRGRLDRARVPPGSYRLLTIDGWALRLLGNFPKRSGIDLRRLEISNPKSDYPAIRRAAAILLRDGHISDILAASYSRLIVDEYQDCGALQHALTYFASNVLPTVVLGDPMQAIFGWSGDTPDWDGDVCVRFPVAGELSVPWRWENAGTRQFGDWLLEVRRRLQEGKDIELAAAPKEVSWVELDGTEDHVRQLRAGMASSPEKNGEVLIMADGRSPPRQRMFASQLPGAVTIESVELGDLVTFARHVDFKQSDALEKIAMFAAEVMTNVGPKDLIQRVESLTNGSARKPPTNTEAAALLFQKNRSPEYVINLLSEISKEAGVRTHRPALLRACFSALRSCKLPDGGDFHDAAIQAREHNRLIGRPIPRRAVGSTLLLKGLEADVAVVLDADMLDAKNLYVAMTRGAKRLIVCSRQSLLKSK